MMIDPFVLLTPVLLLAVIALVRFVGCELVFKLEFVGPKIDSIAPNTLAFCGSFTATGINFQSGSFVQWNLAPPLTTTFISATELRVDVNIGLGETLTGPAEVKVINPDQEGPPFTYNFNLDRKSVV